MSELRGWAGRHLVPLLVALLFLLPGIILLHKFPFLTIVLWLFVFGAARGISMEWKSYVRGSIMSTDHFSSCPGGSHLGMHLVVAQEDAAEPHESGPTQVDAQGSCNEQRTWRRRN